MYIFFGDLAVYWLFLADFDVQNAGKVGHRGEKQQNKCTFRS
jgi:hypothetical protein